MADRGRDANRILRWVLRTAYTRRPSADQLRNYAHWHAVSRRDGFDGLEPPDWRSWPSKPIPPGVTPLTIIHPAPAPEPGPRRRERRSARAEKVRAEMRADEAQEAAERLLRRRQGSARPYSAIESEARVAGIPVDVLAVTTNRLGVVTVEGQWCLPAKNGHASAPAAPSPKRRGRPPRVRQAQALLREQLADGPKPGAEVTAAAQAAEIPERVLLAATDALGVRCQRGEWRLPQT